MSGGERRATFLDKPTGKRRPMWRDEIGAPTFPGALQNQALFPDACFAFYFDTAECGTGIKVLSDCCAPKITELYVGSFAEE